MPRYSTEREKFAGTLLAKKFGDLVRAHRRRVGWSRVKLAEEAGLSPDMISKLEIGATGASLSTVVSLSRALGVQPAELFTAEIPHGALYRPELSDLMARLAKLSDSELAGVKGVIEAALRMK